MNVLIIIRVALRSLCRTVLRSTLTMSGVIIGVAAVVALVSLGDGARARIEAASASSDATKLSVSANVRWVRGQRGVDSSRDQLTVDDYLAIRERRLPGVIAISPLFSQGGTSATANGRSIDPLLQGIDSQGLTALNRTLEAGTPFGPQDVDDAATVCILERAVANELFRGEEAVGKIIRIGAAPWLVIGVLRDQPEFWNVGGPTRRIYVPYTSILRRINRKTPAVIALRVASPPDLVPLKPLVLEALEARRGIRKSEFRTNDLAESLQRFSNNIQTMTVLLASIAGISLLVGGIGIMNIMLVSVTERTREIGIRLAIGTRGRDVLGQFIVEATVLSVLGGVLGIFLGVGTAQMIAGLNDWPLRITLVAVSGAFSTSVVIGVFFGWYPARRAAAMDPIEALRYE